MPAADKIEATKVVFGTTPGKLVRLGYLHLHRPHTNRESGKDEYSVQIMIPKENVEDYKAAVAAFEEQKKAFFPKGQIPPKFHNPIKDGDKDVNQKGKPLDVPGFWLISAKTSAYEVGADGKTQDKTRPTTPPGVVGTTRGADNKLKSLSEREIKSGDWGRVSVNFKGYTTGDSGVGVYLNNVQMVKEGEAMTSRKSAADEFADFAEDEGFDPLS